MSQVVQKVDHIKDDDTFGGVFGVTKGLAKNIVVNV